MSEEIYINTGGSFQQPYNARTPANSQTPAQGRSPFTYIAQGRTPFTYQSRSPITYIAQGQAQNPVIANAQQPYPYQANAQTPYIANAQQPYPYIANAQQPYIANAQQPYPYIAAAQQPVIANAQQPYPYKANAQTPYIANARNPFTYQARTPYTYQARYPANAQQPYIANGQNPFTYQARSPFTYQASARASVSVQQPYSFQQQQPVTGRQPYIYAEAVSYIGSNGLDYTASASVSDGDVQGSIQLRIRTKYITSNSVALYFSFVADGLLSGSYYNTSNTYVTPTGGFSVAYPSSVTVDGVSVVKPIYTVEDIGSGYTVRYSIGSTTDDGVGSYDITGTMTTTASTLSTSETYLYLSKSTDIIGPGESDTGTITWGNVSIIFEKSGSTTYTKTFDVTLTAEGESLGGA